jgi:hypothetical protein
MTNVMNLTLQLSIFLFYVVNISHSPAYGVYISHIIRYARAFLFVLGLSKRGTLLTKKLMLQGYNESRLKSSFCKFYGRFNDLATNVKKNFTGLYAE